MWIRFTVALAILVPAMLLCGGGPWYVTFALAVVGFGTGRLVERWFHPDPRPMGRGALWTSVAALALLAALVAVWRVAEYRLAVQKLELVEARRAVLENEAERRPVAVVTLDADGTVRFDGAPIDDRALAVRLGATAPGTPVWVSSDPAAPYARLVEVMDVVIAAGREVSLGSPPP